jgi:predicted nucleotidyltransferase
MGRKDPMRMTHCLDEILGRRSKVALMRYLIRSRRETTGRDLARSVGLDHKACIRSLRELDRESIVFGRRVGRAWFFKLNADFPLVKEVLIPMFKWEQGLLERMAADIRRVLGPGALSIFMFGSTAKGTDTMRSDVDLLIVARQKSDIPGLEDRADKNSDDLIKKYSRVPMHIFMDVKEFRARYLKNDFFLNEVVRPGHLLHGLHVEELLRHGRPKDRRPRGSS